MYFELSIALRYPFQKSTQRATFLPPANGISNLELILQDLILDQIIDFASHVCKRGFIFNHVICYREQP
jgi:hypothetical protein